MSQDAGEASHRRLFALVGASLLVGGLTGVIVAAFRVAQERLETGRAALVMWTHTQPFWGWMVPVVLAALATMTARWLVLRLAPDAAGSGIPRVEAVVRDGAEPDGLKLVPVKFAGGLAAIGAGLALGREGPSVQMGSAIGGTLGHGLWVPTSDRRVLVASGAAAGLASTFSAPISGAVFILEEVLQRFDGRTTIAVLGATGAATAVTHALLGNRALFDVPAISRPLGLGLLLYLCFGLVLGGLGALYNRLILLSLDLDDRLARVPPLFRAGAIGALVGALAWLNPRLVGGGESQTGQLFLGLHPALAWLALFGVVRFLLGPFSYACRTPGGLFAPILLVGAVFGSIAGQMLNGFIPMLVPDATAFALVGSAAFFTATVRAPVTGIVLLVEMTGVNTLSMCMLAAACGAFVAAAVFGSPPIYDALRGRALSKVQLSKPGN